MRVFTHMGFDECGFGDGNFVIAQVSSNNPGQCVAHTRDVFPKYGDFHRRGQIPCYTSILDQTQGYGWLHLHSGPWKRQDVTHAGIVKLVLEQAQNPNTTVLHIDKYTNNQVTADVIHDMLHRSGYPLAYSHIHVHDKGDRRIGVVNKADCIAGLIGFVLNRYFPNHIPPENWQEILGFRVDAPDSQLHHLLAQSLSHVRRRPVLFQEAA